MVFFITTAYDIYSMYNGTHFSLVVTRSIIFIHVVVM